MKRFTKLILMMAMSVFITLPAMADERKFAFGYAVDLLPTAMSAAEGRAGYSFQTWGGFERVKVRLVGVHMYPSHFVFDSSFKNYEINVAAVVVDYFFKDNFEGFWVGTGVEIWNSSIEHKKSGEKASWSDNIITAGAGYVWHLTESVYLDPFAAVHLRTNDSKVNAGGEEFKRERISASASMKIGYQLNF